VEPHSREYIEAPAAKKAPQARLNNRRLATTRYSMKKDDPFGDDEIKQLANFPVPAKDTLAVSKGPRPHIRACR
jgi:hypothetical protein